MKVCCWGLGVVWPWGDWAGGGAVGGGVGVGAAEEPPESADDAARPPPAARARPVNVIGSTIRQASFQVQRDHIRVPLLLWSDEGIPRRRWGCGLGVRRRYRQGRRGCRDRGRGSRRGGLPS